MFKCPKCSGKTKVVQTVPMVEYKENVIYRRIKCLACNTMFITKETFERYTEQYIRSAALKNHGGLAEFVKNWDRAETKAVIQDDGMVRMVTTSAPMTKEDLLKIYQNVDTSNVGVIPPEA